MCFVVSDKHHQMSVATSEMCVRQAGDWICHNTCSSYGTWDITSRCTTQPGYLLQLNTHACCLILIVLVALHVIDDKVAFKNLASFRLKQQQTLICL